MQNRYEKRGDDPFGYELEEISSIKAATTANVARGGAETAASGTAVAVKPAFKKKN